MNYQKNKKILSAAGWGNLHGIAHLVAAADGQAYYAMSMKHHARNKLELNRFDQIPQVLALLAQKNIPYKTEAVEPTEWGYWGFHITWRTRSGLGWELQLTRPDVWQVKLESDAIYDKWRNVDFSAERALDGGGMSQNGVTGTAGTAAPNEGNVNSGTAYTRNLAGNEGGNPRPSMESGVWGLQGAGGIRPGDSGVSGGLRLISPEDRQLLTDKGVSDRGLQSRFGGIFHRKGRWAENPYNIFTTSVQHQPPHNSPENPQKNRSVVPYKRKTLPDRL